MKESMKIAILGNCTTQYIGDGLQNTAEKYGVQVNIYHAPYNQYTQEVLNPCSNLYAFDPDLIILWLEGSLLFPEWYDLHLLLEGRDKKRSLIQDMLVSVTSLVESIRNRCRAKIILNNFKVPYYSPLGILDHKFYPGLKGMVSELNASLDQWGCTHENVHIFDYNGAVAQFGAGKTEDRKLGYATKSPVSFAFIRFIAVEYMRYILPMRSKNKKCLVLDLDNTLWGGVAGEDGLNGITLDTDGPGKCFYDFQKEILNLYHKGILLAINSKNNPEDALEIIESHPHMLLRKKHFTALKMNWNDKATNIRQIAEELNIGMNSMVFIDDNPVEREYISTLLPEVTVVQMPEDPAKYADTLRGLPDFELLSLTEEDLRRNELYQANTERREALQSFSSLEDYLASLKTEITVESAKPFTIPRISQLTLKTNQFNMTTMRYQTVDIEKIIKSGEYLVLSCSVNDRFGDSGISGVCIVKFEGDVATIEAFLLSCRVLGRHIEYAFLSAVIEILRKKNISVIYAKYVKTPKSQAYAGFYSDAGFDILSSDENGVLFSLGQDQRTKAYDYIRVINKIGE